MATEDTLKKLGSFGGKEEKGCQGRRAEGREPEHVCRLTETALLCGKTGSRKKGTIKGDGSG